MKNLVIILRINLMFLLFKYIFLSLIHIQNNKEQLRDYKIIKL